MSFDEVEVTRRRAEAFLANAEYLLKIGVWGKEARSMYRFVVERFKPLLDEV